MLDKVVTVWQFGPLQHITPLPTIEGSEKKKNNNNKMQRKRTKRTPKKE